MTGLSELAVVGKLLATVIRKADEMKDNNEEVAVLSTRLHVVNTMCTSVDVKSCDPMTLSCIQALSKLLDKVCAFLDVYTTRKTVGKFLFSTSDQKKFEKYNTKLTQCIGDLQLGLLLAASHVTKPIPSEESDKKARPPSPPPPPAKSYIVDLFSPGCLIQPGLTYLFVCTNTAFCDYGARSFLLMCNVGFGVHRPNEEMDELHCPCCSGIVTITNYLLLQCRCLLKYRFQGERTAHEETYGVRETPRWVNHIEEERMYEQVGFFIECL